VSRRSDKQRRRAVAVIVATLIAMLSIAFSAAWSVHTGGSPATDDKSPAIYRATVSVAESGKVTGGIGDQFIGLSFESSTLNNGYRYDDVGNLAQLLKNLGSSIMRFGGDTADTSYADTTPRVLDGLDRLAKASGWSVLFTENLAHFNAARATADAKALNAALGSKLFAIACGNEPDVYAYDRVRPAGYTVGNYLAQVNTCYRAIRKGLPHAPIEGPDAAWSARWLDQYAATGGRTVRSLGQHYYPLGCAKPDPDPATYLPILLSPSLAATEAAKLARYDAAARKAGVPLMITETNSACHGGVRGLSNAYASALWVIDYMLIGAEHGVRAMNFHGGLNTLCAGYTVLCQVGTTAYRPQPIYYGMLFTRLLGTGGFLPVKVSMSSRAGNITAFALKPSRGGGVRLMVENLSRDRADATLRLGGYRGTASVLRLTGPSPLATSGVKIQGESVAANGTFSPGKPGTVRCTSRGCPVTIAPYSAVLVTLG
jgi:hypothetical protein